MAPPPSPPRPPIITPVLRVGRTEAGVLKINDYIVATNLGKGSFATVRLARKDGDSKSYAIRLVNKYAMRKILRMSLKQIHEKMLREVEVYKRIMGCSNVVRLYEFIYDEERNEKDIQAESLMNSSNPRLFSSQSSLNSVKAQLKTTRVQQSYDNYCFVMDFCPGSLEDETNKYKSGMPLPMARSLFKDICRGLHYMHLMGVAHCDIKPENILINNNTAYLADFSESVLVNSDKSNNSYNGIDCGSDAVMSNNTITTSITITNEEKMVGTNQSPEVSIRIKDIGEGGTNSQKSSPKGSSHYNTPDRVTNISSNNTKKSEKFAFGGLNPLYQANILSSDPSLLTWINRVSPSHSEEKNMTKSQYLQYDNECSNDIGIQSSINQCSCNELSREESSIAKASSRIIYGGSEAIGKGTPAFMAPEMFGTERVKIPIKRIVKKKRKTSSRRENVSRNMPKRDYNSGRNQTSASLGDLTSAKLNIIDEDYNVIPQTTPSSRQISPRSGIGFSDTISLEQSSHIKCEASNIVKMMKQTSNESFLKKDKLSEVTDDPDVADDNHLPLYYERGKEGDIAVSPGQFEMDDIKEKANSVKEPLSPRNFSDVVFNCPMKDGDSDGIRSEKCTMQNGKDNDILINDGSNNLIESKTEQLNKSINLNKFDDSQQNELINGIALDQSKDNHVDNESNSLFKVESNKKKEPNYVQNEDGYEEEEEEVQEYEDSVLISPFSTDVWSLGIVLYLLITGSFPFSEEAYLKHKRRMKHKKTYFDSGIGEKDESLDLFERIDEKPIPNIIKDAMLGFRRKHIRTIMLKCKGNGYLYKLIVDLLKGLIDPSPETRFSMQDVICHPFIWEVGEPIYNMVIPFKYDTKTLLNLNYDPKNPIHDYYDCVDDVIEEYDEDDGTDPKVHDSKLKPSSEKNMKKEMWKVIRLLNFFTFALKAQRREVLISILKHREALSRHNDYIKQKNSKSYIPTSGHYHVRRASIGDSMGYAIRANFVEKNLYERCDNLRPFIKSSKIWCKRDIILGPEYEKSFLAFKNGYNKKCYKNIINDYCLDQSSQNISSISEDSEKHVNFDEQDLVEVPALDIDTTPISGTKEYSSEKSSDKGVMKKEKLSINTKIQNKNGSSSISKYSMTCLSSNNTPDVSPMSRVYSNDCNKAGYSKRLMMNPVKNNTTTSNEVFVVEEESDQKNFPIKVVESSSSSKLQIKISVSDENTKKDRNSSSGRGLLSEDGDIRFHINPDEGKTMSYYYYTTDDIFFNYENTQVRRSSNSGSRGESRTISKRRVSKHRKDYLHKSYRDILNSSCDSCVQGGIEVSDQKAEPKLTIMVENVFPEGGYNNFIDNQILMSAKAAKNIHNNGFSISQTKTENSAEKSPISARNQPQQQQQQEVGQISNYGFNSLMYDVDWVSKLAQPYPTQMRPLKLGENLSKLGKSELAITHKAKGSDSSHKGFDSESDEFSNKVGSLGSYGTSYYDNDVVYSLTSSSDAIQTAREYSQALATLSTSPGMVVGNSLASSKRSEGAFRTGNSFSPASNNNSTCMGTVGSKTSKSHNHEPVCKQDFQNYSPRKITLSATASDKDKSSTNDTTNKNIGGMVRKINKEDSKSKRVNKNIPFNNGLQYEYIYGYDNISPSNSDGYSTDFSSKNVRRDKKQEGTGNGSIISSQIINNFKPTTRQENQGSVSEQTNSNIQRVSSNNHLSTKLVIDCSHSHHNSEYDYDTVLNNTSGKRSSNAAYDIRPYESSIEKLNERLHRCSSKRKKNNNCNNNNINSDGFNADITSPDRSDSDKYYSYSYSYSDEMLYSQSDSFGSDNNCNTVLSAKANGQNGANSFISPSLNIPQIQQNTSFGGVSSSPSKLSPQSITPKLFLNLDVINKGSPRNVNKHDSERKGFDGMRDGSKSSKQNSNKSSIISPLAVSSSKNSGNSKETFNSTTDLSKSKIRQNGSAAVLAMPISCTNAAQEKKRKNNVPSGFFDLSDPDINVVDTMNNNQKWHNNKHKNNMMLEIEGNKMRNDEAKNIRDTNGSKNSDTGYTYTEVSVYTYGYITEYVPIDELETEEKKEIGMAEYKLRSGESLTPPKTIIETGKPQDSTQLLDDKKDGQEINSFKDISKNGRKRESNDSTYSCTHSTCYSSYSYGSYSPYSYSSSIDGSGGDSGSERDQVRKRGAKSGTSAKQVGNSGKKKDGDNDDDDDYLNLLNVVHTVEDVDYLEGIDAEDFDSMSYS